MSKSKIVFLLIFVLGIIISFYNIEKLYIFEYDQERDYNIVHSIVEEHKITLLGPRVVSSSGFYLAPWYFYLQVPFYYVFNGNPIYGAYFASFVNFLTGLVLFFLLRRELRSTILPALSCIFWFTIAFRSNWNVSFIPIFFFLLMILEQSNIGLQVFIFALGLNFHPQLIFLLPLIIYRLYKQKHRHNPINIFLLPLSFITPFIPIIFFDIRHNFVNINGAIRMVIDNSASQSSFFRPLYSLTQFSTSLDFLTPLLKQNPSLTVVILLFVLSFVLTQKHSRLLFISIIFSILLLSFLRLNTWPEYYFLLSANIHVLHPYSFSRA